MTKVGLAGTIVAAVILCFASGVCDDHCEKLLYGKAELSFKIKSLGRFDKNFVAFADKVFADARLELYPAILKKRSGKRMDYFGPEFGLLTESSVRRGLEMMEKNKDFLGRMEKEYGVPTEYLVSILRIETNLGKNTGSWRTINSFFTMVVLKHRRAVWAEQEFVNFLLLCFQGGLDPFEIRGSYMGAFGLCQFVPTSYIHYAVDGNGDGKIDLFNLEDALASTANYLKQNGWSKGKKMAILAYNESNSYVEAVIAYAEALANSKKRSLSS